MVRPRSDGPSLLVKHPLHVSSGGAGWVGERGVGGRNLLESIFFFFFYSTSTQPPPPTPIHNAPPLSVTRPPPLGAVCACVCLVGIFSPRCKYNIGLQRVIPANIQVGLILFKVVYYNSLRLSIAVFFY